MDRKQLILAYAKANRLTPDLAFFFRSRSEEQIMDKVKNDNPNSEMLIAAGIPILTKPGKKIATDKEINSYLQLHCSAIGMEYTGYEETDKITAMIVKLDKIWEKEISELPYPKTWFEMGLPHRIAKVCGAASIDTRYSPLLALYEKNIWVYGPDRETFVWYIYNSSGEELTYY